MSQLSCGLGRGEKPSAPVTLIAVGLRLKRESSMNIFTFWRKKKRKDTPFYKAIEFLKSGDWDAALEILKADMLSLTTMSLPEQGNYIMAIAILDGAAGNKHSAIHSVRTALKMCPDGSPNARLLNFLGHHIENPPETFVQATIKMRGRPVDVFFHLLTQVTISVVETGTFGSDELVDQLNRVMEAEYHRMNKAKNG